MEDISEDSVGFETESEEGEIKTDDSDLEALRTEVNHIGIDFKIIDEYHSESDFEDELQLRYQALKSAYMRRLDESEDKQSDSEQNCKENIHKDIDDRPLYCTENIYKDIDERERFITNFYDVDERPVLFPAKKRSTSRTALGKSKSSYRVYHSRLERSSLSKHENPSLVVSGNKSRNTQNAVKGTGRSKTKSKKQTAHKVNIEKKNALLKKLASSKVTLSSSSIGHEILKTGEPKYLENGKPCIDHVKKKKSGSQEKHANNDHSVAINAEKSDLGDQYNVLPLNVLSEDTEQDVRLKDQYCLENGVQSSPNLSDTRQKGSEVCIRTEDKLDSVNNMTDYVRLDEPMDTQSESEGDPDLASQHAEGINLSKKDASYQASDTPQIEDEDEELLRAQLLIEISQRQKNAPAVAKKSLGPVIVKNVPIPETLFVPNSDDSVVSKVEDRVVYYNSANRNAKALISKSHANRKVMHIQKIKNAVNQERLVISLEDSDEENCENSANLSLEVNKMQTAPLQIADQVESLLKEARKASEMDGKNMQQNGLLDHSAKIFDESLMQQTPQAISHLPAVKQQEYKILRKRLEEKLSHHPVKRKRQDFECKVEKLPTEQENPPTVSSPLQTNVGESDMASIATSPKNDGHQPSLQSTAVEASRSQTAPPVNRKQKYLHMLRVLEKKIVKQRAALEDNLSSISELLDEVSQVQESIKLLQPKIQEQRKYLQQLETELSQKKSRVTQKNAVIKEQFHTVQISRNALVQLETRCHRIGQLLFSQSYSMPQKHVKDKMVPLLPKPVSQVSQVVEPKKPVTNSCRLQLTDVNSDPVVSPVEKLSKSTDHSCAVTHVSPPVNEQSSLVSCVPTFPPPEAAVAEDLPSSSESLLSYISPLNHLHQKG